MNRRVFAISAAGATMLANRAVLAQESTPAGTE